MSTPAPKLPFALDTNRRLDRWVTINTDGTVTVRTGKVEIGQGIVTAMAQLAADELDVNFSRIRMVPVDTTQSPDEGSTSGSRSIEEGGTALRYACAEVRDALLQAAARKLGTTLESLAAEDGTIEVRGSGERITYWQLAPEVDLAREATGQVSPKQAGELRIVGKTLPRLDIPAKLAGAAYVQDLDFPGMLHGRVVRPPSYRARLQSVDLAPVRAMTGVRAVVREGSFLGVVAEREEQAIKAMKALGRSAEWREQADLPDADALPDFLRSQSTEDEILSEKSSAAAAKSRTLTAAYTRPYLAHASIGPSCAVARWHDGKLEVWSHSQAIYPLRDEIAKILKMEPARIVARHAEGAGCYGHNGADDVAFDAALLARAVEGRPVRVQWMRMDELAEAAGVDPVEFRLRHLKDERARAVIRAAAAKAGWKPGTKGDGTHGVGMGFARYKNAGDYVAVISEVIIEESVRVSRVVAALDCGRVVSPDGIINQAEGGIVQATSWTLKEQVRFDNTRITSRTWDDYPILTFGETPEIETVLIDRPEEPSVGVGEGMQGPTAAAIANAVFNAMGVRVRDLPLTRERIVAAMSG